MSTPHSSLLTQHLKLGFSPCPNDTFIFDALIHQKIDTEGLKFETIIEDVETLNNKALEQALDVCKLSFFAYGQVAQNYVLLDSGAALGTGVGPLLLSARPRTVEEVEQQGQSLRVGIPGKHTTAFLLLKMAFPKLQKIEAMCFSEIEQALLDDKIDLGLIIHENRFTYASRGLYKVLDLGEFWEQHSGQAIPLGGIAIKRSLPQEVQQKMNRVLRQSVQYAFDHPSSSSNFVRSHAQSMSLEVMQQHIELYVNTYTLELGHKGRKAIEILFDESTRLAFLSFKPKSIFLS